MKYSWILWSAVSCSFWVGCHSKQTAEPETSVLHITSDKVTISTNAPQLSALEMETVQPRQPTFSHLTGRLVWDENATVRVFSPVAGRVSRVFIGPGERVKAGDILAKILSPDYGQAQADARKASADLMLAERNLNRLKTLYEHGAAARKDLEAAEDAHTSAQSEQERATARLAMYGGNEGAVDQLFSLKSPLEGVVVDKNINPGQEVRPDQMLANAPQLFAPLFVISDPTRLWLILDMTEQDIGHYQPGQIVQFRTRAYPDKVFRGQLDLIGSALDPATRTVKARASVLNPQALLRAEMYVTVAVEGAVQTGVTVPTRAVFLKENQYYIFVEQSPGKFERRMVRLGEEEEGRVAIVAGLEPGQRIVTQGCLLLKSLLEAGGKS